MLYLVRLEKKKKITLAIIFNTTKGKGIKKFENDPVWHAKSYRRRNQLGKIRYFMRRVFEGYKQKKKTKKLCLCWRYRLRNF